MEEAVFARIAALEQPRDRLRLLSSTPAALELLSKADLEELRRMHQPPQAVKECLEVVWIVLHLESAAGMLDRLPPDVRLVVPWPSVQAMLAKFDTFFPAMANFDIAGLMAAPRLARYLSQTYFGEQGLTQERVYRCSVACAALFRWCSRSMARVEAALELLIIEEELLTLAGPSDCWRCKTEEGWREYGRAVHMQLDRAEEAGNGTCTVPCEIDGTRYEMDLASRTQRNVATGFSRPIRPPGNVVDLRALQGCWRTSWGSDIRVRGKRIEVDGQEVAPELELLPDGSVRWVFLGEWRVSGGSPLCVEWSNSEHEVTWVAAASEIDRLLLIGVVPLLQQAAKPSIT